MKPSNKNTLAQSLIDDLLGDDSLNLNDELDLSDATGPEIIDIAAQSEVDSGDKTIAIDPLQSTSKESESLASDDQETKLALSTKSNQASKEEKISVGVGRPTSQGSSSLSAVGLALTQSENLKIAQNRILDLEKEIERLRRENEQLAAAGETFKRRGDELLAENEQLGQKLEHEKSVASQEKDFLQKSLALRRRDIESLQLKVDELEGRLSTNIQKIRVRERELENRLELVKMEGQTLVRSKDEYILELKRQIDQLNLEMESFRQKSQESVKLLANKQDTLRRTVKALRLALSMLEGDDEVSDKKKAG